MPHNTPLNGLPCFDTLKTMAAERPQELERLRRELAEQIIARAPSATQQRLRGLQFQIDMKRRLAKNQLTACMEVSALMLGSLEQLRRVFNGDYPHSDIPRHPAARAAVIPFRSRKGS